MPSTGKLVPSGVKIRVIFEETIVPLPFRGLNNMYEVVDKRQKQCKITSNSALEILEALKKIYFYLIDLTFDFFCS